MAETAASIDTLIKWPNDNQSAEPPPPTAEGPADDQRLTVSAPAVVSANPQLMLLPDAPDLRPLVGGLFSTAAALCGAPEVQHGGGTPASTAAEIGAFSSTAELANSGSDEQDGSSPAAPELVAASVPDGGVEDNSPPLGSSQNPIRIIQQGNKYTSLQKLSQEQLGQIMQVIQQQQLLATNQPSVLYNPDTQTKIIYRVVHPSDIHRGSKSAQSPPSYGRKRPQEVGDAENSGQARQKSKKARHRRTRSGRVCRPPQYMVKDYKQMPTSVNFGVEAIKGGGDSDSRESSGDEGTVGDEPFQSRAGGGVFDVDEEIPTASSGKPKSFKCGACEKRYVGPSGLARHYRLHPEHGSAEDLILPATSSADHVDSSVTTADNSVRETTPATDKSADVSNAAPPSDSAEVEPVPQTLAATATQLNTSVTVGGLSTSKPSLASSVKRKRGRPALHPQQTADQQRRKLRDVMKHCSVADLLEVIPPRLTPELTLWRFLSTRVRTMSPETSSSKDADVTSSNVDVAVLLREYATVYECVRRFCADLLENDAAPEDSPGRNADCSSCAVSVDLSVSSSAVQSLENCHPWTAGIVSTQMLPVADNASAENIGDALNHRSPASCSEASANVDSVAGGSSGTLHTMQTNCVRVESGLPPKSASMHINESSMHISKPMHIHGESREPNGCWLPQEGNTETGNLLAANVSGSSEAGNFAESGGNFWCAASAGKPERGGLLTENSVTGKFAASDCCKGTDSEEVATAENSTEDAVELSKGNDAVSLVDESVSSDDTAETDCIGISVVDNVLKISSVELARCLGLAVQTGYRIRTLTDGKDSVDPEIPESEILGSSEVGDGPTRVNEQSEECTVVSFLPPRKRPRVAQSRSADNVRVEANSVLEKVDLDPSFEGENSALVKSGSSVHDTQLLANTELSATDRETVTPVCFATAAANLNSAAKNSFASLTAPLLAAKSAPVRRGRKPRGAAPPRNPQPAAVVRSPAETNGFGVASPRLVAAVPTPNVIHVPEDARVVQTEDGMIIVCLSDGTVQIHGHTEGQPIPLDTIRSLQAGIKLPLPVTPDIGQSTVLPNCQDAGPGGLAGKQYLPIDGQPLLAFDPNTQSMFQIDAGNPQSLLTLASGGAAALVAVDGPQPILSVAEGCFAEAPPAGTHGLIQVLTNSHMQQ